MHKQKINKNKNKSAKNKKENIKYIFDLLSIDNSDVGIDLNYEKLKEEKYNKQIKKRKEKIFTHLNENRCKRTDNPKKIKESNNSLINETSNNTNDYINQIFKSAFHITYDSKQFYIYTKKNKTYKNKINFVNVNPNGNCFCCCLSEFLFSNSLHHRFIRNAVSLFQKK